MNVHLFAAIYSPNWSNYALRRTADDFEEEGGGSETANVLRKNFYIDDCLQSEKPKKGLLNESTALFAPVHVEACILPRNKRRVLETIPEKERSKEVKGELHSKNELYSYETDLTSISLILKYITV